jgi:SAM-dependent methyltransferase
MTGPVPSAHIYDRIGRGYTDRRRPDPRIGARIHEALGAAATVVDFGAGAGAYEPTDRRVVAVEPSEAMVAQRPAGGAPVVRAVAGSLPFPAGAFDGALAVLTVHHWPDPQPGLEEIRRVTRGPVVVLSFDQSVHLRQWLVTEYLPEMAGLDTGVPAPSAIAAALGGGTVEVLPVPHDCTDGFCHAWWRRPHAYLDPGVRAAISGIARLPDDVVERAVSALRRDLADGTWHRRHAALLDRQEIDAGYRLILSP